MFPLLEQESSQDTLYGMQMNWKDFTLIDYLRRIILGPSVRQFNDY